MDLSNEDVQELVDLTLNALAEALRDQAAKQAEQGHDEEAALVRIVADRVQP